MSTRLYLPSSGVAPVSPAFDSGWNGTSAADRRPLSIAKGSTPLASKVIGALSGTAALSRQYVSPPLAAQNITGTLRGQIRANVTASPVNDFRFGLVAYWVSNDGSLVKGVFYRNSLLDGNTLYSSGSLQNRFFPPETAIGSWTIDEGDRLVFEIGSLSSYAQSSASSITHQFGENVAGDLPIDEISVSSLAPWIEFSADLRFSVGRIAGLAVGHAATSPLIRKRGRLFGFVNAGASNLDQIQRTRRLTAQLVQGSSSAGIMGRARRRIAGSASGRAIPHGTLRLRAEIHGLSTGGINSSTPTLRKHRRIAGSSSGSAGGTPRLGKRQKLAGLSQGVASADLPLIHRTRRESGIAFGASTADAVLRTHHEIFGRSDGQSSASATIRQLVKTSGSSAGQGGASATLRRRERVGGSAAGIASSATQIRRASALQGTSDGRATVPAVALDAVRVIHGTAAGQCSSSSAWIKTSRLVGLATGSSAAAATIRRRKKIAGSTAGTGAAAGALHPRRKLIGVSHGQASALLNARKRAQISGTSAGAAFVPATIVRHLGRLFGIARGQSDGNAILRRRAEIRGSAGSVAEVFVKTLTADSTWVTVDSSVLTADMTGGLRRKRRLAGLGGGGSASAGTIHGIFRLDSTVPGRTITADNTLITVDSGTVTADTGPTRVPTAAGSATASGKFNRKRETKGQAAGVGSTSQSIHERRRLFPQCTGTSTATANVVRFHRLAGLAQGSSSVTAVPVHARRKIAGQSLGVAAAAAVVKRLRKTQASAAGKSIVSQILRVHHRLFSVSNGASQASAQAPRRIRRLPTTSSGKATASAAIRASRKVSGRSGGAGATFALLRGRLKMAGAAGGTSTLSQVLRVTRRFVSSSAEGLASVTALLRATLHLPANSTGSATAGVTQKRTRRISGVSAGGSIAVANLVHAVRRLPVASAGNASAAGFIRAVKRIRGGSLGTSLVTGDFNRQVRLHGSSAGLGETYPRNFWTGDSTLTTADSTLITADRTGTIRRIRRIPGSSIGATDITHINLRADRSDITVDRTDITADQDAVFYRLRRINGLASGQGFALLNARKRAPITGASSGQSSAVLNGRKHARILGSAAGTSTAAALLRAFMVLLGESAGTSTAQLRIRKNNTLVGFSAGLGDLFIASIRADNSIITVDRTDLTADLTGPLRRHRRTPCRSDGLSGAVTGTKCTRPLAGKTDGRGKARSSLRRNRLARPIALTSYSQRSATARSTLLGDLLHHRGKLVLVRIDENGQLIESEFQFKGYADLKANAASYGLTATENPDGTLSIQAADSGQVDLVALGTNLLNAVAGRKPIVDIAAPYQLENYTPAFDGVRGEVVQPVILRTEQREYGWVGGSLVLEERFLQFVSPTSEEFLGVERAGLWLHKSTVDDVLTLDPFGSAAHPYQNSELSEIVDRDLVLSGFGLVLTFTQRIPLNLSAAGTLYDSAYLNAIDFDKFPNCAIELDGTEVVIRRSITFGGYGWPTIDHPAFLSPRYPRKYWKLPLWGKNDLQQPLWNHPKIVDEISAADGGDMDGQHIGIDYESEIAQIMQVDFSFPAEPESASPHHVRIIRDPDVLREWSQHREDLEWYQAHRERLLDNEVPLSDDEMRILRLPLLREHYNNLATFINACDQGRPFTLFNLPIPLDDFTLRLVPDNAGLFGGSVRPINHFATVQPGSDFERMIRSLGIPIKTVDDLPASYAEVKNTVARQVMINQTFSREAKLISKTRTHTESGQAATKFHYEWSYKLDGYSVRTIENSDPLITPHFFNPINPTELDEFFWITIEDVKAWAEGEGLIFHLERPVIPLKLALEGFNGVKRLWAEKETDAGVLDVIVEDNQFGEPAEDQLSGRREYTAEVASRLTLNPVLKEVTSIEDAEWIQDSYYNEVFHRWDPQFWFRVLDHRPGNIAQQKMELGGAGTVSDPFVIPNAVWFEVKITDAWLRQQDGAYFPSRSAFLGVATTLTAAVVYQSYLSEGENLDRNSSAVLIPIPWITTADDQFSATSLANARAFDTYGPAAIPLQVNEVADDAEPGAIPLGEETTILLGPPEAQELVFVQNYPLSLEDTAP